MDVAGDPLDLQMNLARNITWALTLFNRIGMVLKQQNLEH